MGADRACWVTACSAHATPARHGSSRMSEVRPPGALSPSIGKLSAVPSAISPTALTPALSRIGANTEPVARRTVPRMIPRKNECRKGESAAGAEGAGPTCTIA